MKWIEGVVNTESEEIDSLCDRLTALGAESLSIEDEADLQRFLKDNKQYWDYVDESLTQQYRGKSRVKFYLRDDEAGQAVLETIKRDLGREIHTGVVDDADWENAWQQYYEPIPIGKGLLIVPEWLDPELEGRKALRLDPGLAFGTGSHPTTQMCLEALDALDLRGKTVLDLGCGSGILGIGALVLGAESVEGCDVDPLSPEAAKGNAALNGMGEDRFRVRAGDILKDRRLREGYRGRFDLVLANIVADVILQLSPLAGEFLKGSGPFLCSGVIDDRAAEVEARLRADGWNILEHKKQEEWNCYVCMK